MAELQARIEELESLEDRARAVGGSITKAVSGVLDPEPRCRCLHQEIYLRDLNQEFTNLKLTENVTSAQAATANFYNDWQETYSGEIKRLTRFISSALRDKQIRDEEAAFRLYCNEGEPRNSDY